MPWRPRYLSSRRHPVAVGLYLVLLLMGAFFVSGLFNSQAISSVVGPGWQTAWEWQLLIGGVLTLVGVIWPWDLDEATGLEQAGAVLGATGFLTLAAAIVQVAGWANPSWVIYGVLAVSLFGRTFQIWWGKRQITRLVHKQRDAQG